MKTPWLVCSVLALLVFSSFILANDDAEVIAVKKVVKSSYFNGAFNKLDTEAMRTGFHPTFSIFSAKGKEISKYPIDTWITGIEKRKKAADFDISKSKMDCKIINADVTGGSAAVKVQISKDGTLIYTDYLSLLKFEDGWKIVAKVYHRHK